MRAIWFSPIEPNENIASGLRTVSPLITIEHSDCIEEVLFLIKKGQYDCIVYKDKEPTVAPVLRIRSERSAIPIIAVCNHSMDNNGIGFGKLSFLDAGVDYYIENFKGPLVPELACAIMANARRFRGLYSSIVEIGDVTFDMELGKLYKNGEDMRLKQREVEIFCYLLFRRGKVVSNTEIEEAFCCSINNISAHLCTMAGKLRLPYNHPARIVRFWGRGLFLRHNQIV